MTAIDPAPTPPPPPPSPAPPVVPTDASVVLDGVSKSFSGLVAVSDVSLALRPGVTALLGPNGAGKSTLIRLICGLARPTTGRVWVAGGNPRTNSEVRGRIGLVPQQDGIFETETAWDTVRLSAVMSRVDDPDAAATRALEQVDLDADIARPVGKFSKGMRQRVKIAQALVHNPAIVVLDEPMTGLDPIQRRSMISLFHQLGDAGRTVLVSSHVLDEVERIGSDIVVLARGRLAAQGDYRQIRSMMDRQPHRIRVVCSDATAMAAALVGSGTVNGCQLIDRMAFEITTTTAPAFRVALPRICRANELRLYEVRPLDDDLESVFHYLLGGRQPGGAT